MSEFEIKKIARGLNTLQLLLKIVPALTVILFLITLALGIYYRLRGEVIILSFILAILQSIIVLEIKIDMKKYFTVAKEQ